MASTRLVLRFAGWGLPCVANNVRAYPGGIYVPARSCASVACDWDSGIWLCNDRYTAIAPSASYIASARICLSLQNQRLLLIVYSTPMTWLGLAAIMAFGMGTFGLVGNCLSAFSADIVFSCSYN